MPDDDDKPKAPPTSEDTEEKVEAKPADQAPHEKDEEGDQDEGEDDADRFRPEAIAKRIESLGQEDEIDRIAREEEKKLLLRQKKSKKGKKGLAAAASKRLARIGEESVKRPSSVIADAADADPLLERTVRVTRWIKSNKKLFRGLVTVAVLGTGGFVGWRYYQHKQNEQASALLATAVLDERGKIGDPDKEDDEDTRPKDPRPTFKTAAERRDAALAKYREVESKFGGTGAAILARLAEGSLLLDKADVAGAIAAFNDVKATPLAQADVEVRGRALEGLGFAYELRAQKDPGAKDKAYDDALHAFRDLEMTDTKGLKELGMYHQARVYEEKGDKAKAIELLKTLRARVEEPGESHPFSYLEFVVDDRLRTLDPSAAPPKPSPSPHDQMDMNDPRVREMIEKIQKQMQEQGGGGGDVPLPVPPPK
jgi:hypothetical protein